MDPQTWLNVVSRWVHIGAAIVLFGGTIFQYFVVMPAVRELPADERKSLHERIVSRWRKIVGMMIGLILLSGFYNYYVGVTGRDAAAKGIYHMLMGIKILLALGVFFIASALVGRSAAFEKMRLESRKWMTISILLAAAIVAIAGYLKVGIPPVAPAQPQPAAADSR